MTSPTPSGEYRRRDADRMAPFFFLAGILFMTAALAVYVIRPNTPAWLVIALAVLGALLLPTDRILRGLRIWRKSNGTGEPPSS